MTKNDQWVFQCIHVGTMSGLGNCYVQCCLQIFCTQDDEGVNECPSICTLCTAAVTRQAQTIAVASCRHEPARVINDEGQANPRRSGNNQV